MSIENRTCLGICKQYKIKKPSTGGRYEAGQARCQICNIWIDYKGCILKDHTNATPDSTGWICKCCNFRVRRKPRNSEYKEKLRSSKNYTIQKNDYKDTVLWKKHDGIKHIAACELVVSNTTDVPPRIISEHESAEKDEKEYSNKIVSSTDNEDTNNEYGNESIEDHMKRLEELRTQILQSCKESDSTIIGNDYSYVEMFELLEHYLKLLPKYKKYGDVRNFL